MSTVSARQVGWPVRFADKLQDGSPELSQAYARLIFREVCRQRRGHPIKRFEISGGNFPVTCATATEGALVLAAKRRPVAVRPSSRE